MSKAFSTYKAELYWGESDGQLQMKMEIKGYPDILGEPEMLEKTTTSDAQQTFTPGIRQGDNLAFTGNYTKENYQAAMEDAEKPLFYALKLSDGSGFKWQGQHTMSFGGKNTNEVVEFGINVAVDTTPEWSETITVGVGG